MGSGERSKCRTFGICCNARAAPAVWGTADEAPPPCNIHDPIVCNLCAGVEVGPGAEVKCESRIGDFYQEPDILGGGRIPYLVLGGGLLQNSKIRLRLAVGVVLRGDVDGPFRIDEQDMEDLVQP